MFGRKFAFFSAVALAAAMISGCATAGDHQDPRIFKKIGVKGGCDVFQTYDSDTERHYRVDCPDSQNRFHKPTMGVALAKGVGDPRIKCRVTYVNSSQPAHDYGNISNPKWVSATTIKCWGPRVAGDL